MINKNKILSLCMAAIITASTMPTSVLAASVGSSSADKGIGLDTVQNAQTVYTDVIESNSQSQVYLTVDDSPIVASLPTSIILSGEANSAGKYIGNYSISAQGEVSGDKVVNIAPDKNNVELIQKGKNNKNANIEQQSTAFDSSLLKDTAKTTGVVTADKLTAGSWNSSFNFDISVDKINSFYSSLDLAVADINAETVRTKNTQADLYTSENAVCGVYKNVNGSYRIELYKDLDNQKAISINKDVEIDLNNHTVNFAVGAGFVFNANSNIHHGTVNTVNTYSIQNLARTASLTVNNMNILSISSDNYNGIITGIATKSIKDTVTNSKITVTHKTATQTAAGHIATNNQSTVLIDNCDFDVTANNGHAVGCQIYKNNITNSSFTVYSSSGSSSCGDGVRVSGGISEIYDVDINVWGNKAKTASNGIVVSPESTLNLHSAIIKTNSDTLTGVDCANHGIVVAGKLNIDESKGKVFVKGGNCAISVDKDAIVDINGGTYCSPNHGGLYNVKSKNITINNALFYNSKTAGEDKDATCIAYGGMYSSGPGTIKVSNSKIIGGNHGIRIKNDTGGSANVTIDNSYIEGQNDVLSLAAGTFTVGENVVIKSKTGKLIEDNPQGTLVDPNGVFSK